MISPKPLLTDLQKWVTKFENDLRQRCREVPELDALLKADWQKARESKRTAEAYEVWRDGQLTQSAVGWVLGCVFVRFLEDNQLLDRPWIAGGGDRRIEAEHVRDAYFSENGTLTDRDYLQHVFTEIGKLPGMADLFDRRHNALWRAGISGDVAADFIAFWRKMDHDFTDAEWGTRFLGDLYQDLSEYAKKTFALLQTPEFIEEFILDRTLDPAIDRFGYEQVRMIDPTCGSGHFVLGGFKRLLTLWQKGHPEMNEREIVKNALAGVAGVDLNPFAVAITRFRLLLAAWKACAVTRLRAAPDFHVNLAVGDSLLHGPVPGELTSPEALRLRIESANNTYEVELPDELAGILGQRYHAVVGNPPYITVKDKALSETYRSMFSSCKGKYSLSVPFMERFFDLAIRGDCTAREPAGFTGQITANSFMKRAFGKKLIEECLPRWDLTHVIDTSGTYIPGHGTPTVILFGRNQRPATNLIRTVLGIRGEPLTPADPALGLVWQALLEQVDQLGSESEWLTVADSPRPSFHLHPWSIGGGGAAELKEQMDEAAEETLDSKICDLGMSTYSGADEVYLLPEPVPERLGSANLFAPSLSGDDVRDFLACATAECLVPYDDRKAILTKELPILLMQHLWRHRTILANRLSFGRTHEERGLAWFEPSMFFFDRFESQRKICHAYVATHNHFVLLDGRFATNRHAPVLNLPATSKDDDYFQLLGLLNSSVACFWMKQVSQPKATVTGDISVDKGLPEANRYEFASTVINQLPIPKLGGSAAEAVRRLAAKLHELGIMLHLERPAAVIAKWAGQGQPLQDLRKMLTGAAENSVKAKALMVLLHEELDWAAYVLYGIVEDFLTIPEQVLTLEFGINANDRPFAWRSATAPKSLPFELQSIFNSRRSLIDSDSKLRLLENSVCKRPWLGRQGVYGLATSTFEERIESDLKSWFLSRLETAFYEGERITGHSPNALSSELKNLFAAGREPRLCTTRQLADIVSHDPAFMQAAAVYRDREDFDVPKLVQELVEAESVPFLPIQRYKDSGLRKRVIWERTWDLQRQEDQIEADVRKENADKGLLEPQLKALIQAKQKELVGDIPVPPKYANADFKKSHWWKLRGKLDVPKERWIIYSGTDTPSVIAWAGWNHKQQAQALAGYYQDRKDQDGWSKERLAPLIAGLKDLLPWLKQWHNDLDPVYNERLGNFYEGYLRDQIHELGMNETQIEELRIGGPA